MASGNASHGIEPCNGLKGAFNSPYHCTCVLAGSTTATGQTFRELLRHFFPTRKPEQLDALLASTSEQDTPHGSELPLSVDLSNIARQLRDFLHNPRPLQRKRSNGASLDSRAAAAPDNTSVLYAFATCAAAQHLHAVEALTSAVIETLKDAAEQCSSSGSAEVSSVPCWELLSSGLQSQQGLSSSAGCLAVVAEYLLGNGLLYKAPTGEPLGGTSGSSPRSSVDGKVDGHILSAADFVRLVEQLPGRCLLKPENLYDVFAGLTWCDLQAQQGGNDDGSTFLTK